MKKKISLLLVISFIFALSGCSAQIDKEYVAGDSINSGVNSDFWGDVSFDGISSNNSANINKPSVTPDSSTPDSSTPDSSDDKDSNFEESTQNFAERKIVYSVNTRLQTKDLNKALDMIKANLTECGGYIQSEEMSNNGSIDYKYQSRSSYMELRIPSSKLEQFLAGLEHENLYTVSMYKDSMDYSESYYDKESRIASLRIQEKRLLELLEQASDITVMLDIESRLSNIRYDIESLTKQMNIIDSNVDYSTVTIRISEVVDYDEIGEEPKTFFEEIKDAIKESWESFVEGMKDFVIWLILAFPALVIWSMIICGVIIIVKKIRKKKKHIEHKE